MAGTRAQEEAPRAGQASDLRPPLVAPWLLEPVGVPSGVLLLAQIISCLVCAVEAKIMFSFCLWDTDTENPII